MTGISSTPILRPAESGDIAAIAAIYAHHVNYGLASFEEIPPDEAEMFRRWQNLTAENFPYIVAVAPTGRGEDRPGSILGYAYAGPYRPRSAYRFSVEDSIYLRPDRQGRGLGRLLLARLITEATALGKRQMIAVIGDSANTASIRLHAALGFALTGTFQAIGYKFGRWVDSVLMQRPLGEGAETLPEP